MVVGNLFHRRTACGDRPLRKKRFGKLSDQEQTVQIEPKKPDQTEEIQKNIRAAIEQMTQAEKLKIGDVWIAAIAILPEFYERRQFKPAWTAVDKIDDLMRAIDDIEMDGLIPDDYHRRQLREMSQKIELQSPPEPQLLAYRDLLLDGCPCSNGLSPELR